jgi:hypothetical protein
VKAKLVLVTLAVTLLAATAVSPASAQVPIQGVTCTNATGDPVGCTLQLVGFTSQGGTLNAVFQLTNTVTGQVTRVRVPIVSQQQGGSCTILELRTQRIELFLLGLNLVIDPIHIVLTAQRGTLLGDLLCGLFFGNAPAGVLNQILRDGQVTATPLP